MLTCFFLDFTPNQETGLFVLHGAIFGVALGCYSQERYLKLQIDSWRKISLLAIEVESSKKFTMLSWDYAFDHKKNKRYGLIALYGERIDGVSHLRQMVVPYDPDTVATREAEGDFLSLIKVEDPANLDKSKFKLTPSEGSVLLKTWSCTCHRCTNPQSKEDKTSSMWEALISDLSESSEPTVPHSDAGVERDRNTELLKEQEPAKPVANPLNPAELRQYKRDTLKRKPLKKVAKKKGK